MKSLLILSCIAIGISGATPVTFPTRVNAETFFAQTNPPPATPNSQTAPLIQAASALLRQERYQLESTMEITGDIPGTFFKSAAQVNTILEAPNKINSEITFVSPNGLEGKTYQIVSDGTQVWIYNLATNQYSISDLKQFLQTREAFLMGTLSYFYVTTRSNFGSSTITANVLAKLPEERLVRYFQRFANVDLQSPLIKDETIEGKIYKVYDLNATNRGFELTAYVAPEPLALERIDLAGTKDGLQLATQEQIINQTILESIPAETFSFSPPDNAEQVARPIAIEPF